MAGKDDPRSGKGKPRRALCLAGGGPAVGLSIGALERIWKEPDIRFDVWSLSCIGAWLGIAWNQAKPGTEITTVKSFFKQIFRPDDVYEKFPIAAAFAPDFETCTANTLNYVLDSSSYQGLVVPEAIKTASEDLIGFMTNPGRWSNANLNATILNDVLAVNPVSRFMTSMMYKSATKGLARIFYPDSEFLQQLDFKALYDDRPALYHNAYNLTAQRLELFSNREGKHFHDTSAPEGETVLLPCKEVTAQTLCACSALPYIEEPVTIDGTVYCEGATVDTVNFQDLLTNHPELDEVWVSRILDRKQIRQPRNLYDALNNLVMLFAATTSEDDVKLFKYHLKDVGSKVRVVEIPVAHHVNYDWSWENLARGIDEGYVAADKAIAAYRT